MEADHDATEDLVRRAFEEGDHGRAATAVIEHYGPDVLGFLVARLGSRMRAAEVFSIFSEDLWAGLPGFRWECSMRGFAYAVARNAATRYLVAEGKRQKRSVNLDTSGWARHVERVQTRTQPYLQTPFQDAVRALRARLPPDDQTLLLLRIGRNLPWRELAIVFRDPSEPLSEAQLERESARLRKRFSLATARLKELARAEGWLEPRDE
ncbi:MAG: polymerase, sigma-24 subunit, subfamily protein [Myxococcaceae bacterium]|nr:polymerase, sigma-24 subunit, subfamily protein [Myxococcaceae bacterium]